jgi:hypothetical protein
MKSRLNYVSNSSSSSCVLSIAIGENKTFDEIMDKELSRHLSICLKCNKLRGNLSLRCIETPFDFENIEIPFEQRNVPRSCELYAEQFVFNLEKHGSNGGCECCLKQGN